MEDRITLKEFTHLYNLRRSQMTPPRHKVTFSLMKSKVVKKRKDSYVADENGVPKLVGREDGVSKQVVDTNGLTKLYQAMWSHFLGVELKRISSEGNYRHGIGFIKSSNKGLADLMGGYNGKVYYIEIKQKTEKLLPSQIAFKAWVESFNGEYHIVTGFDDMYSLIKKLHSPQSS